MLNNAENADRLLFFILGAGASFDSGLPTYRGPDGLYNDEKLKERPEDILSIYTPIEKVWDFIKPLYENIAITHPGPTYDLIKKLGQRYKGSFILTQNIDGHALTTDLPVVEIHGTYKTMTCCKCNNTRTVCFDDLICACTGQYRPNIVLYGQSLPKRELQDIYTLIKRCPTDVIVIGTTLQFPYLRHLIAKAKSKGAHVTHINPDDDYIEKVMQHNETWHKVSAVEGLNLLAATY